MADRRPKWYIDTLDGRGGFAFASWRISNLEDGDSLSSQPTFYFSPPTFAAIPILSSATALAAERFGFQLGLFDEEGEIPFASTAAIAEFVRRIYIGSGRSDGTDGGGPVPVIPPTLDPDRGRMPDLPTGWLKTSVKRFIDHSKETPRGEAQLFLWSKEHDESDRHDDWRIFVRGAELTFIEMLARFPSGGGEPELQTWEVAAARLAAFLLRIDLSRHFDEAYLSGACHSFFRSVQSKIGPRWPQVAFDHYPIQSTLLMLLDLDPDAPWLHHRYDFAIDYAAHDALPMYGDPLDDLAHFPISADISSAIRAPDKTLASVADALSAVLGSPAFAAPTQGLDAIALFAAGRIVSHLTAPWNSFGRVTPDGRASVRSDAHLNRLVAEASQWLVRELPRLHFSPAVERLIENQP